MYRYAFIFIFVFSFLTPVPNAFAEGEAEGAAAAKPVEPQKPVVQEAGGGGGGYGKSHGIAGPVVIAPVATLIGFPSPFRVGVELKGWNVVGLGFDYGFLPQMTFDEVKVKYNSWRITAKAYPFKGALFVGISFGKQNLTGTGTENITVASVTYPVTYNLDLKTTIISPHIGWRWVWDNGFMFGMEYGVQLASNATSVASDDSPAIVQSTQQYIDEKNKVQNQANKLGNQTLPHFALVQLGYFF